ncbi:MAG TPA: glycerophosphodiester phosphodiesterase family protein [Rhizomicrobium sp.]|nr:glycerophosphodiester phosphodiesterase family protein [Rhizomicrobium sp.]
MTLNIAHRGGAGLFPENTLAAFRNAVALGCDGAELDVQLSRDGEVVVFHDFCLKSEICRDVNGAWLTKPTPYIKDLTLAELRRYDIGRANPASDYAPRHAAVDWRDGERIPTLGEIIDIAKGAPKPFRLFVEIKTSFADRMSSADPKALAEAALKVVDEHDHLTRTVLVGFDWPALLHAKQLEPQVECWFTTLPQSWFADAPPPVADEPPGEAALQQLRYWARTGTSPWAGGYDAMSYGGSILRAIKAAGGDGWFPMYRDITSETANEARALQLKIGAWTVNDAAEMRALCPLGIDAICTDRPDILTHVLGRT